MNTIDISNESLEDAEIDKYIQMISKKSYGHTLEDQRKRVKAGCIIARHLYKAEKEKDKGIIDKLVFSLKEITDCYDDVMNLTLIENAKKLLTQLQK